MNKKINKYKVIIPILIGASLTPIGITVPIISNTLITSNNLNRNKETYYLYDNQYFSSLEEATNYAVVKNKPIKSDLYVGNVKDAIFDLETGRLDINELRKLDDYSRLKPAFKNALGSYSHDYYEAKKSFVNRGLIRYKYDDLNGNIFETFEEAKDSMVSKNNKTPIMYNKIKYNNKELKINPLSLDDINEFKLKAMKNVFQNTNNFSLNVYGKDNNKQYSNKSNRLFTNENSIFELVDYMLNQFLIIKNNFLVENSIWDVQLNLNKMGKANDYRIDDFYFNKANYHGTSKEEVKVWRSGNQFIKFENLSFLDLKEFNTFFSKGSFRNKFSIGIDRWALNDVAERAWTKGSFLGSSFTLRYHGGDKGAAPGIDIKILEKGSEGTCHSELKFDVNVSLKNKDKLNNMFNDYFSYESLVSKNEHIKNLSNNIFINSLLEYTWNELLPILSNNMINEISNNWFYKEQKINNNDCVDLNKNIEIDWLDKTFVIWKNSEMKNKYVVKKLSNTSDISSTTFNFNKSTNPTPNLLSKLDINNFLSKNKDKYLLSINYNSYPLFLINNDLENLLDINLFTNNYKNNMNAFIPSKQLLNMLENSTPDSKEFFISNLTNISQSFEVSKEKIDDKTIFLNYDIKNNQELFASKLENFDNDNIKFESSDDISDLICPSLTGNENFSYSEESVLGAYNFNVNTIKKNNNGKIPETSKKYLIKPNEILHLYDGGGQQLGYFYGEYLATRNSFNKGLLDSNINIYYDNETINNVIRQNLLVDPAKIVIVYDLLGNIINPGVKLTKEEELLTTSDAIYDSESTVIDNILRTKIIRNDPTKVFYLEDDNETYTLLDNKSDLIYSLTWNNKTYYFASYSYAWNYMYDAIKLEAIQVVK